MKRGRVQRDQHAKAVAYESPITVPSCSMMSFAAAFIALHHRAEINGTRM